MVAWMGDDLLWADFFCRCLSGSAFLPGCSCSNWNVWSAVYVDDGGSKPIITVLKPWFGDEHPFWCCDATRVLIHTHMGNWKMTRQCQLIGNSLWEFHVGNIHAEASWLVALQLAMQNSMIPRWPTGCFVAKIFVRPVRPPATLRQPPFASVEWQSVAEGNGCWLWQSSGRKGWFVGQFQILFPCLSVMPAVTLQTWNPFEPRWEFALYKQKHEVLGGHFETLLPSIGILGLGLRQGGDDTLAEWPWLELTSWWFQILIPYLKCWSPRLTLLTFTSFKIFEGAQSPAFTKDSMKAPAVCLVPWVAAVRAALNHGGTRRPKRDRREAKRKQLQLATVDPVPWECLERYPLVVKHPGGCKIVPQFKTFKCCSLGYQIITRSTFPLCC